MTFIVNLSAIHKLQNIYTQVIPEFASLLTLSQASVLPFCCPNLFHKLTNASWVALHYQSFKKNIDAYKLGRLTTSGFLNELLKIFNFLNREGFDYDETVKQDLFERKEQFLTLRPLESIKDLTNEFIAKALLEQSWNTLIKFDEDCKTKFEDLLSRADDQPIYFVSNTNELNIDAVLFYLKTACPQIAWNKAMDINPARVEGAAVQPIQIAPNIYLCPSYVYQTYKTPEDNKKVTDCSPTENLAADQQIPNLTTSDLIQTIIEMIHRDNASSQITVVSQWPKDLLTAQAVDKNLTAISSEDFYLSRQTSHLKCS